MKNYIDINEGLLELCKYQHEQIKQYKEFIEKTILVKIYENYTPVKDDPFGFGCCTAHEVIIPETRFMALQTPYIQRNWEIFNWETPVINPEIYRDLLYKAVEKAETI
jgi:hypothetical protein